MKKLETVFKIMFPMNGNNLTATVRRFALKTIHYLVEFDKKNKIEVRHPIVLFGNKKSGELEYPHLRRKQPLFNSIASAIRNYCTTNHIDLI